MRPNVLERLCKRITIDEDGCWRCEGRASRNGYARVSIFGKERAAHRVMYELLVGPIPDGLLLGHVCRVRNCVNPDHLEPVTHRENTARGEAMLFAQIDHAPVDIDEQSLLWYLL